MSEAEKYDVCNNYLRMYKEYDERRPGYQAMLTGIALQLLVPYFRWADSLEQPEKGDAKTKSWVHIENAVSFIYKNLCETELDNQQIADAVGVSANYLTKLFQDHLGISLHTYMRPNKAKPAERLFAAVRPVNTCEGMHAARERLIRKITEGCIKQIFYFDASLAAFNLPNHLREPQIDWAFYTQRGSFFGYITVKICDFRRPSAL